MEPQFVRVGSLAEIPDGLSIGRYGEERAIYRGPQYRDAEGRPWPVMHRRRSNYFQAAAR